MAIAFYNTKFGDCPKASLVERRGILACCSKSETHDKLAKWENTTATWQIKIIADFHLDDYIAN